MTTQKDMVLEHMRQHGSITDLEAYNDYGIRRLAATIFKLRDEGYDITTENTQGKNRYGRTTNFATYSLREGTNV